MTKVILKTYPDNPRVLKAQVTAKYCDVEVDIQSCNMKEGEHKSEAFLKVNPFHQVPTAFTESGDNGVFESNSIARYIARLGASKKNLLGKDALEASRIDAFLDAGITYETWFGFWYYTHIKLYITEENTLNRAKERLHIMLTNYNRHLGQHEYLVGDSVTLADICLFSSLSNGMHKLNIEEQHPSSSFHHLTQSVCISLKPIETCICILGTPNEARPFWWFWPSS